CKARATSILKSVREKRATQKIGKSAIGPPGWLEKGSSASLLVRYVSQRIRSSLAPYPNPFEANGMPPTYETMHLSSE
ncbi:MAG TPA: hypothetical protein VK775_11425, partial [Chthoniobacterales bacterium]|nr:hypothetical protein [Chthoniobacterales bacterium]